MQLSDEDILKTFRTTKTKEKGFEMLVIKYRERLYWQIRRMVDNHDDTDDILQNVYIKVWKYLDNFKENALLHTWLYRITTNETLTFIKQKKKRAESNFEDNASVEQAGMITETQYSSDEIEQKLEKAINTLPDKQKLVFKLRYYDEMSYHEMSELLKTSEGALKASYHHAVKKIEDFLTAD